VLLGTSLIGRSPQEDVDLGLDRLLHEEPDREPADLLEHARQVAVGVEQRVNVCANALAGGYSWCHGRRSSF
jgi:hypothetical protein